MKKLLKVLLKQLKGMMEYVLVFMRKMMEIFIVLAKTTDYEINAVANYILKKYERN